MSQALKAPFPYFGGKSRIAPLVWTRFGDTPNYVEPFGGSLAVLLARPFPVRIETVNDASGFIVNFWRAVQADPNEVAKWADNPVFESDLHARNIWCVNRYADLTARLEGDPLYYDVQAAGWWVWGQSCSIRCNFGVACGSWNTIDGKIAKVGTRAGVKHESPELDHAKGVVVMGAHGVKRALPLLGSTDGVNALGVDRERPTLEKGAGRGTTKFTRGIHLGDKGTANPHPFVPLENYFGELQARLRRVRILAGDWTRCMGDSVTTRHGVTAVFLDPPYSHEGRESKLYKEEMPVADAVREWAIENGDNPMLRIALCGYDGEHDLPTGWECVEWKANGGYGNQSNKQGRENAKRERIWFSPHCLRPITTLFDEVVE